MPHGGVSSVSKTPKLVKALGHLTTPISTLRFNHDAQILAMASKDKKDAMRLVGHLFFFSFGFSAFSSFHCCTISPFPDQPYDFHKFMLASGLALPPYFSFALALLSGKDIVRLFI